MPINVEAMPRVATVATIEDALDRYYRPERLRRDAGTRGRLAADRAHDLARDGYALLASRHDSVTGTAVWIRRAGKEIAIHQN
jgi:hypothetical protein